MDRCVFCEIARADDLPHLICRDELVMACMDLRQFHPGHVLVMPVQHLHDVRDLDPATGAALMWAVSRLTRAVAEAFPHEGITLWSSIGPAAFQEVPHLHIHIHPRRTDDHFQRLYPAPPEKPGVDVLRAYADRVSACLT